MNNRLSGVIDALTYSKEGVAAFQDRFTASSLNADAGACATFLAVLNDRQRLGYVNVRGSADEITDERCFYIAILAVAADAENEGAGQSLLKAAEAWAAEMGFSRIALDVFFKQDPRATLL